MVLSLYAVAARGGGRSKVMCQGQRSCSAPSGKLMDWWRLLADRSITNTVKIRASYFYNKVKGVRGNILPPGGYVVKYKLGQRKVEPFDGYVVN